MNIIPLVHNVPNVKIDVFFIKDLLLSLILYPSSLKLRHFFYFLRMYYLKPLFLHLRNDADANHNGAHHTDADREIIPLIHYTLCHFRFYTECLGMKLLRKRDIPEEKYTNA